VNNINRVICWALRMETEVSLVVAYDMESEQYVAAIGNSDNEGRVFQAFYPDGITPLRESDLHASWAIKKLDELIAAHPEWTEE